MNKKEPQFPTRWLSYKSRIRNDVDFLYGTQEGEAFFNENYMKSLEYSARRLEARQLRLIAVQTGLIIFLLIGIVSQSGDITVLGISVRYAPGLQEVVLAFSATIGLLILLVSSSKDLRLYIVERIVELKSPEGFADLAKIAAASGYDFRIYMTKPYLKWVFAKPLTKTLFFLTVSLFALLGVALYIASIAIHVFLLWNMFVHPKIAVLYSRIIFWYVIGFDLLGVLWLVVSLFPLPFSDRSSLQGLEQLKISNPTEYAARIKKLYGENGL
jgi:hypothetical protein